jgi:hypothetical protein
MPSLNRDLNAFEAASLWMKETVVAADSPAADKLCVDAL